jgi:hypothetical protein
MKQPFILLIVLILFSKQSFAQKRGDNVIIVKNVSYETACKTLLNEGFIIDKRDAELQTVKTEPKSTKGFWLFVIVVNIRIVDSSARITTTFTMGDFLINEPLGYPATKGGKYQGKSASAQGWEVVDGLARKMGSEIEYIKE